MKNESVTELAENENQKKVTLRLTDEQVDLLRHQYGDTWPLIKRRDCRFWFDLGFRLRDAVGVESDEMVDILVGVSVLDESRMKSVKRLIADRLSELKRAESPARRKTAGKG